MDVRPADILVMKKPHPCGSQTMYVIRAGMDFKLRCTGCGREFMVPRNKIERRIKQIRREAPESECMPVHIVTERKAGTQICWKSFGKWKKTIT